MPDLGDFRHFGILHSFHHGSFFNLILFLLVVVCRGYQLGLKGLLLALLRFGLRLNQEILIIFKKILSRLPFLREDLLVFVFD